MTKDQISSTEITGNNLQDADSTKDALPDQLNAETPWPLYQQVKQLIIRRIRSGHWPPDTRIPSENELVQSLGVSRMTANRALRELTVEGHIIRRKGAGTFVAKKKPQFALLEIHNIADEIKKRGGEHSSQVHLLVQENVQPEIADVMALPSNASIFHSILIHRENGIPIQIADRYVNPAVAPDYMKQDFSTITPSKYLLKVAPITEAEHIIEAVMPDTDTCNMLEIEANEPCLVLHRTTWVKTTVATVNRFIYPGSRYTIGGRFTPSSTSEQITA